MLGGSRSGPPRQTSHSAWLAWDPQETFSIAPWSLRPPDLESHGCDFPRVFFVAQERGLGTRRSFLGERAAAAGPGTGESPHVPAVPLRRQLSWIDLSWFLMKAASACQRCLGAEGEEALCTGNGGTGERCCPSQHSWGRPGWELRVGGLGLLITGFPRYQCSDWCHSSFLTHLSWSLGGSLWPVPSAEHSGWASGFPARKPKPPLGMHTIGSDGRSCGGALGRGQGRRGSQVGGRQVVTWEDGCAPRPCCLQLSAALRPPGKCACCPTGQAKTPICVSRQLRCRGGPIPSCLSCANWRFHPRETLTAPCLCFLNSELRAPVNLSIGIPGLCAILPSWDF